ncbi:MAG TPA: DUF488 domain-containing protein [Thermomicrobiaceae bacterium]|nr:DUF488 domain-containing protein [Thermomicrobiaceae bacterium]
MSAHVRQSTEKTFVVLANSFKYSGRCVAGREVHINADGSVTPGPWIRPVSDREEGELLPEHYLLEDDDPPRPLDIVSVPLLRKCDDPSQPENWLVDPSGRWRRIGVMSPLQLPALVDRPADLWLDPGSPTDRLPVDHLEGFPPGASIYLLHLPESHALAHVEGQKEKVRLRFSYGGADYSLTVTDPAFKPRYRSRLAGGQQLALEDAFVCVSLGRPFNGHHYKLVAAVIPPMTGIPLFTVGHSALSIDDFIALLRQHQIEVVADVRSQPYSRWLPHFSREALRGALHDAGIQYVFLGRELGARREEPECYVDGKAEYDRIAETPAFKDGIRRVARGATKYRIALMCAEKDPLTCHRTILVCRRLWGPGFDIIHIHDDGHTETQSAAERRLMDEERFTAHQLPMFAADQSVGSPLDQAYASRGAKIAYRRDEPDRENSDDWLYPQER